MPIIRKLCQCLGISALLLLAEHTDLLGGGQNARLHAPVALTTICLAYIVDILLLALLLFMGLMLLRRTRIATGLPLLLVILVPPYIFFVALHGLPIAFHRGLLRVLTSVWGAIVLSLYLRLPARYAQLVQLGSTLGAAFGLFAVISLMQILWLMRWKPMPPHYSAAWTTMPQPPRNHSRVVWLVLDELSYDQTFEHRAHDLALPSFDALRTQSILFTDVQPAGYATQHVIPSLLSGRIVDRLDYDMQSRLRVHHPDERGWYPLTGANTVFADAKQLGWRTAVVGWYNPYCTVYRDAIDDCYWDSQDAISGPLVPTEGFWRNVAMPLQYMALRAVSKEKTANFVCNVSVRQHHQSNVNLEHQMLQVLHADQADLVFLHLNVPHGPGIWNRRTGQYTQICGSSYIDNLTLADRDLGLMMNELQQSPRWKDTTFIVQGDHSWRIGLWKNTQFWTHEDDVASHGVFDTRPALLIHQAGQTQPQTNTTPWPLLRVHDIVEEVLHGQEIRP